MKSLTRKTAFLILVSSLLGGLSPVQAGGKSDALNSLITYYDTEKKHWDLYLYDHCEGQLSNPDCEAARSLIEAYADLQAQAEQELGLKPTPKPSKRMVYEAPFVPDKPDETAAKTPE